MYSGGGPSWRLFTGSHRDTGLVPLELGMTSLMHFEEKVHRKGLVRAESLLLLMLRLLCQVLEHLGFPEEPQIEMRIRCPLILSMERVMTMPVSFLLRICPLHLLLHILHPILLAHIYIISFAGVCSCQFERDNWCDGCYFLIGSYSGSPGSEVSLVSLHAAADYDSPGSSSCFGSEGGAYSGNICIFGCFGSSSSCYRPTTTTAVRWLGFFYIFV